MSNRFVLDASLFKKYSLDQPTSSDNPISLDEIFMRLVNEGRSGNFCKELKFLIDLLDAVIKGEATICLNEEINNEYKNFLNKIPSEIEDLVWAILSNANSSVQMDSGGFTDRDFDEIKGTTLQSKGIYLDLAKTLKRKIIVSTEEDKEDIYTAVPNDKILLKHGILCRYTWECWEELNKDLDC